MMTLRVLLKMIQGVPLDTKVFVSFSRVPEKDFVQGFVDVPVSGVGYDRVEGELKFYGGES